MATMIPNPFWRVVAPHGSVILNQNRRRMIPIRNMKQVRWKQNINR